MEETPRHENAVTARARRVLAEEDETLLRALDPQEAQRWCDCRMAEYESRILALRSARNDAAPIHRFLPPELLLEIFGNLLPPSTRRRHGLPVLRVCRRWRMLVLDTPQFWVNLIGQPLEATRIRRVELAQLRFAVARSAALKLTLSWRGCGATAVDLFLPYAERTFSFTAIFSNQEEFHMARFMESEFPFLEHLSLTYSRTHSISPIAIGISRFPRLQALQLMRSPLLIPTTRCSLRELDLLQVSFRDRSDPGMACGDIGPILDVLSSAKHLEILRVRDSLPEDIRGTSLSASRRIIQLPLLRTLVVRDDPRAVRIFLAYLEFPSTTLLSIEIQTQRIDGTIVTPFPPSLNTTPADDADVSLVLKLESSAMAHWETYVNGCQTLRLTVFCDWESRVDAGPMDYTREVMALFAPPRLITSLTISGSELGSRDRAALLADLPRLRRLAVTGTDGRLDGEVLAMLAKPGPEGELLCPSLEHLSFSWLHTSDRLVCAQDRLWAQRFPRPSPSADVRLPLPSNTGGTATMHLHGQRGTDDPKTWKPYGAAASQAFCQTVAAFLARRTAHPPCSPLKSLGVSIRRPRADYVHHWWDVPSVRARLEEGLGHLVGSISVEYEENVSPSGG